MDKKRIRGAGKVAFWARKESIEKMLEAKHTMKATFLAHEKDVGISYGQFRLYVNEFIKEKPTKKKQPSELKIEEKIKPFLENLESTVNKEDMF